MAVGYERIPDIDSGGGGGSGRNYRKLIAGHSLFTPLSFLL
jgi:hypothetical protein